MKELDGPLRDPGLLDVDVLTWLGLLDVLALTHESERILCPACLLRERQRFWIGGERKVVIVPFGEIRCAAFGMAPHSILENVVPDVAAA
ncbi:MAG TPA: hypothetical protein VGM39_20230 [Kofleriaceae bacterium]